MNFRVQIWLSEFKEDDPVFDPYWATVSFDEVYTNEETAKLLMRKLRRLLNEEKIFRKQAL